LVAQGAKVSLISRSEAKLNAALEKISCEHDCEGRVAVFPGDVSNFDSINSAVQRAIAKFGAPEIVIPCAGFSKPGYFHQQDPEIFK
jgi:NAD(P)-dependent dehydrogenase (short-subunit alcohol dehydrogenase family)